MRKKFGGSLGGEWFGGGRRPSCEVVVVVVVVVGVGVHRWGFILTSLFSYGKTGNVVVGFSSDNFNLDTWG